MKWCIVGLALLNVSSVALAGTEDDGRLWTSLGISGETGIEGLRLGFELLNRYREEGKDKDSLLVRPQLHYAITPALSVGVGYEFFESYVPNKDDAQENRLWQQVQYVSKLDDQNTLTLRSRLEERHRNGEDEIANRIRFLAKIEHRLISVPKLSLIGYDEIFYSINNTEWGVDAGRDQYRVFLGAGYKTTDKTKVEVGYLNQNLRRSGEDGQNHVLSMSFNLSL
jgi:hypothetical protein